jgi:hypothetical protein
LPRSVSCLLPAVLSVCLTRPNDYAAKKKADAELARAREEEKAARSYDSLFSGEVDEDDNAPRKTGRELEEDFM